MHFLPPIAGFVGSDALAGRGRHPAGRAQGALHGHRHRHQHRDQPVGRRPGHVTSCASGPAFEGYQITHGMKAVEGAIERVAISRGRQGGRHGDDRRRAARRHLRLGRGRRPRRPGAAGVVDATGRMQLHAQRARGPPGARVCGGRGRARRHRVHPARRPRPAACQGRHRHRLGAAAGAGRAGAGRPAARLRGRRIRQLPRCGQQPRHRPAAAGAARPHRLRRQRRRRGRPDGPAWTCARAGASRSCARASASSNWPPTPASTRSSPPVSASPDQAWGP